MKLSHLTLAVTTSLILVTGCSHTKKSPALTEQISSMKFDKESVKKHVQNWPEASKNAAIAALEKFGSPDEVTETRIMWEDTEPFKRTIVFKEAVPHDFPTSHNDVVLQTIDYRVPLEKVADLIKFNGSLIVDRTKGELSSRSNVEEMNILALNLADEIVQGRLTAEQARTEYNYYATAFKMGNRTQYLTALNFMQVQNTGDADQELKTPTMQAQEVPPEEME